MNELIKEIAEQAANEIADQFKPGFFDNRMVEDVANIIYKHHEQFAELIVQECIKLYNHDDVLAPVGNSAWGEAYQDGWIAGTQMYKETIKEHFGIEQ